MRVVIVDLLEQIDVGERDGPHMAVALRELELALEEPIRIAAVEQPRQVVSRGLQLELSRLFLEAACTIGNQRLELLAHVRELL